MREGVSSRFGGYIFSAAYIPVLPLAFGFGRSEAMCRNGGLGKAL